jgi:hypothetical protein
MKNQQKETNKIGRDVVYVLLKTKISFFLINRGCPDQLACISTNPTSPKTNDHVSLQLS